MGPEAQLGSAAKPKPKAKLKELLGSAELWRAQALAAAEGPQSPAGLPTGFPWLDRLLPDGGWPRAALAEILCDAPGLGELRLLLPGLAQLSQTETRWLVWLDPPFPPYAPALAAAGVEVDRVLLIRTGTGQGTPSQRAPAGGSGDGRQQGAACPRQNADLSLGPNLWQRGLRKRAALPRQDAAAPSGQAMRRGGRREENVACPPLWALEQALASGACSAVLAWLDERRLRLGDLRRLQLRAKQGGAWGVLFRPQRAAATPSAAQLRLSLRPDKRGGAGGGQSSAMEIGGGQADAGKFCAASARSAKVGSAEAGTGEECEAADQRLLLSILKRRGGWGLEDLPLTFTSGGNLEPLLHLWRQQAAG